FDIAKTSLDDLSCAMHILKRSNGSTTRTSTRSSGSVTWSLVRQTLLIFNSLMIFQVCDAELTVEAWFRGANLRFTSKFVPFEARVADTFFSWLNDPNISTFHPVNI
ncbi:hypothetical protein HAX54_016936, partial [Datura stramonium]|nr:hypothetical protein [Datura stramonium]